MKEMDGVGGAAVRFNESVFAPVATAILTFLFVLLVVQSGGSARIVAALPAFVVLFVCMFSFDFAVFLLVTSLFVDFYFYDFSFGVWFSLPFGLAFILRHKDLAWKQFANPLTGAILFYGICILPSFLNASQPAVSLLMLFNVAAFLIVLYALVASVRSLEDVRMIAVIYLGWVIVDSLDVIALGLSGSYRPFGFAGIWFVDYSALGVCLAIAIALVSRGGKRTLSFVVALVVAAALVLTQTRNTWLSAIVTLTFLAVYVLWRPHLVGFTRRQVSVPITVGFVLMIGLVVVMLVANPRIEKRAVQITEQPGYGISKQGQVESSLGSRLMIWDTALNAFEQHPIVGIGVYAFRYSSNEYYRIPKMLYKLFVAKLSPHQTHLAVLSETGLLGFLGYLVFMVVTLKHALRSVRTAKDDRTRRFALAALTCVVYCSVSMFSTDAWLWGQQIILLAIVIGSMLAIEKIGGAEEVATA